jgi:hypothetical protein
MMKTAMKIGAMLCAVSAIALIPVSVQAQERVVDSAGGALAGAIVAGPVGLVAGGVIGYAGGPSIARGLGLKGHRHYRHHHRH